MTGRHQVNLRLVRARFGRKSEMTRPSTVRPYRQRVGGASLLYE
jgi:hypothetical protein